MTPSIQTVFISGFPPARLERQRSWSSLWDAEGYGYAHSQALICPRCLKQWALLQFSEDTETHPQGQYCELHGGGTLFWDWHFDPELLKALPEALLKREFDLTLKQLQETET